MSRKIECVNVKGKTIYVNFDDGRFGTHSHEDGKWFDSGLTADELNEAKRLALKSGKWTNYRAPRVETFTPSRFIGKDEEDLEQDDIRNFRPTATFAGESDKEQ